MFSSTKASHQVGGSLELVAHISHSPTKLDLDLALGHY